MNTTTPTPSPTRPAPANRLRRPPRSTRTRFALAAAVGLVAVTGTAATATGGVANLLAEDIATGRGIPTRDESSYACRLYESDAWSWGETGAHLPQGCTDDE